MTDSAFIQQWTDYNPCSCIDQLVDSFDQSVVSMDAFKRGCRRSQEFHAPSGWSIMLLWRPKDDGAQYVQRVTTTPLSDQG